MNTIISNEDVEWQEVQQDGRVLSVVRSGKFYRFVVEALVLQPESDGLEAYTYPEELHLSGLYNDEKSARDAAQCFLSELR